MEPASSSDDDSSIDEEKSTLPRSMSDDFDEGDYQHKLNNFDDLPSEDSCLDSDSDDSSDGDDSSDDDGDGDDNHKGTDEMALGDRVYERQHNLGVKRDYKLLAKKKKAVEIAQKKLREMKNRKVNDAKENHGSDDEDEGHHSKKKKSKHAPTTASSLRYAYFSRGAPDLNSSGIGVEIGANKYRPRDPRHQSLSGHFDQSVFEKRYEFLDKMQDDEIEKLKQRCKAWNTTGKKGKKLRKKLGLMSNETSAADDDAELKRLKQERAARLDAKVRSTAKRNVKKRLRDDVAAGKRGAFYLKKRDLKRMELEAKFEELKRVGGDKRVNDVIAKKRKKKMGKDSSFMPNSK